MANITVPIELDHEYLEKLVHEVTIPAIQSTLEMLRQDILDKLAEERSEYHISDVGIGLERALKSVDEYIALAKNAGEER